MSCASRSLARLFVEYADQLGQAIAARPPSHAKSGVLQRPLTSWASTMSQPTGSVQRAVGSVRRGGGRLGPGCGLDDGGGQGGGEAEAATALDAADFVGREADDRKVVIEAVNHDDDADEIVVAGSVEASSVDVVAVTGGHCFMTEATGGVDGGRSMRARSGCSLTPPPLVSIAPSAG